MTGDLIRVANASMAIRLAQLMNDEAEGKPLPEKTTQHVPIRFQLAHAAALPGPGVAVLYVHRSGTRAVASAPSEQQARRIARLLTHIDYPMDEHPGLHGMFSLPKAHDFGDKLGDLPEPTPAARSRTKLGPYRKRILGLALWTWLPLIALAALAAHIVGWLPVVTVGALGIAGTYLAVRALRQ